jgi:exopolysaccharide production protein ExoQ
MPPLIAISAWFTLLLALFYFDPARDKKESWALWVPLIWMFFVGSRDPSQWLNGPVAGVQAAALQEGSPLDRTIFSLLIAMALGILIARSFQWGNFFYRNLALMAFLAYCLTSALWSDFPFITIKHWIRDLANYLVSLVILTDPRPLEAIRTVLRRLGYLVIPLSVVLIKYFPGLGRQYGEWSGMTYFVGVCTSKNMLGAACLVIGLFFFWDIATRWPQLRQGRTRLIILINVVFIGMTLWVMHMAQSTTSTVCLGLGSIVVVAGHMKIFKWRPGLLKAIAPTAFGVYLILTFALDMRGQLAGAVGKDATLTDRTEIWAFLLNMHTNPTLGVGYQTFWIGARLEEFWSHAGFGHLNEAHNGYLEIYLELGLIGVFLLCLFLISSYRSACSKLGTDRALGILGAATWLIMVFYNMSESAFEGGLLFMLLLMGTMSVPQRVRKRIRSTGAVRESVSQPRLAMELSGTQTTHWSQR